MHLDNKINELANDLINFMQQKFEFDRIPKILFIDNKKNSKNLLAKTGGYDPEKEEITIYITNRHAKDILRSLAHEMLHHVQKCEGMMDNEDLSDTSDPNYIVYNNFLKNIEADAFERGNICFREWEASKKGANKMDEAKKKTSKKGKPDYLDFDKDGDKDETMKDALADKESKIEESVKINDALKNSHYYIPTDRAAPNAYNARDERIFNELMAKFKIKK